MPRYPRVSALGSALLICLGQTGCAQTPAAPGNSSQVATLAPEPAAGRASADLAESYAIPTSSPAYHTNYVEVYDATSNTVTHGHTPGYSNTYIYEELAAYGTGLFSSADYYDWGGYPVYYPYPYTIGSSSYYDPRIGTYGGASRSYGPYGGQGLGHTAVGQSKSGAGYAARNHSNYGGRSAYNRAYTQSSHRNVNHGYGARQRGMNRSHQSSHRQVGVRRTGRRR